jgi:pyruvate kinase
MPRETQDSAKLGPCFSSPEILTRLIAAGVDVVRMNFSHGAAQDHIERAKVVRSVAASLGRERSRSWRSCKGRRSASARFADGKIDLGEGDRFTLDAACELATRSASGSTTRRLPNDVRSGDIAAASTTADQARGDVGGKGTRS